MTSVNKQTVQWDELILGGVGAMCAGFFTNPLEVIKTRIQLQGELRARGQYTVHYKNVFHAFYQMARNESLVSLQKGLVPGLWYQFIMNGCRFGFYQMFDNFGFTRDHSGNVVFHQSIACGVTSGMVGSFLASPFYLVKTQLQSKSDSHIAVGHQHQIRTMTSGFGDIFKKHGLTGLWRGSVISTARVSVGGSIQLTSFNMIQNFLDKRNMINVQSWYGTLLSSMLGSCFVVVSMTPFDVVTTRLYNQPVDLKTGRGLTYDGIIDCMTKIFQSEGFLGFYKGFSASFLRLGPHTILSIFFWQLLRREYMKVSKTKNERFKEKTL